MTSSPDTIEPYLLTIREWQCAHLYVQGLSTSEIARRLKCAHGTVTHMLGLEGVRSHITTCAKELAQRERMTEEYLYATMKQVMESPASTGAEKIAAARLVSRWKGMEIERIEITERGAIDELEKARRRAVALPQEDRQDVCPTSPQSEPQTAH